tara:strand:+ start:155463 stop:156362 length:900 start_codon:yes stop_codon:yes gene_type:complete
MKLIATLIFVLAIAISQSYALPSMHASETQIQANSSHTIFTSVQKQITKWSIVINREIPKRMKVLKDNPSWAVVFASAAAAFLYGIIHTLGPGHGKMVVASYFLTNGAHISRGIWVGVQVALSHVGGAILIVLIANLTLKNVLTNPEQQVFWAKVLSYSIISFIGLFMFYQAMRQWIKNDKHANSCSHCNSQHHHKSKKETILSWAVGAVPCTGSLLILVYAMAYDVLWLGLFMVSFIALGMAITMISIGTICIYGKKKVIDRLTKESNTSFWYILLELFGALTIISIGIILLLDVLNR